MNNRVLLVVVLLSFSSLFFSCNKESSLGLTTLDLPTATPTPEPTIDPVTVERMASATLYNEFGAGTSEDPYLLYNSTQLVDLADHCKDTDATACSASYKLKADVDMDGVTTTPIGRGAGPFVGSFDGLDHTISNLTINETGTRVGFFGLVGGGSISNLTLTNADISNDGGEIGILAGDVTGATIDNVTTSGSVTGGNWAVGGLIGYAHGVTVSDAHSSATVICTLPGDAGGLIGDIDGVSTLDSSSATGAVTGGDWTGGLVGWTDYDAAISNSWASGAVTGKSYVGGLVGQQSGTLTDSYATGSVTASGLGSQRVGGLVGESNNTISNSHATGNVSNISTSGGQSTGGLVGEMRGATSISHSYATGSVTSNNWGAGGFLGAANSGVGPIAITSSYATGTVSIDGQYGAAGGFAGDLSIEATISDCYSTGNVIVTNLVDTRYGAAGFVAFFGANNTVLERSYSMGTVTGLGYNVASFISRLSTAIIRDSFTTSTVTGTTMGFYIYQGTGIYTLDNNYDITDWGGDMVPGELILAPGGASDFYLSNHPVYANWDFTNVWNAPSGGLPTLR